MQEIERQLRDRHNFSREFRRFLSKELAILKEKEDWYLYHEYLCSENHLFTIQEFCKTLAPHKLLYAGDAEENSPPIPDTDIISAYDTSLCRRFRAAIIIKPGRTLHTQNLLDYAVTDMPVIKQHRHISRIAKWQITDKPNIRAVTNERRETVKTTPAINRLILDIKEDEDLRKTLPQEQYEWLKRAHLLQDA